MPKSEQNMTEKQFLRILTSSVCCIVLCLVGLVSTTWAWYNLEIECTNNVIQVGTFDADVTVQPEYQDENGDIFLADPAWPEDDLYILEKGTYMVMIQGWELNTSPGYYEITVQTADMEEAVRTAQTAALEPGVDEDGECIPLCFRLVLTTDADVRFIRKMGRPTMDAPIGDTGELTPELNVSQDDQQTEEDVNPE